MSSLEEHRRFLRRLAQRVHRTNETPEHRADRLRREREQRRIERRQRAYYQEMEQLLQQLPTTLSRQNTRPQRQLVRSTNTRTRPQQQPISHDDSTVQSTSTAQMPTYWEPPMLWNTNGYNMQEISPLHKEQILTKLRRALGPEGMDETVCCVCDRLVLRKGTVRVSIQDEAYLSRMKIKLKSSDANLSPALMRLYDHGAAHSNLAGMMLSKKGIVIRNEQADELIVCMECDKSLMKSGDLPPKFAIANNFFIGELPESFDDLKWIECIMVQQVSVIAQTKILRGGPRRMIRSHSLLFDATAGPPATILPRRLEEDSIYRVVLAGTFTAEQETTIRLQHTVRNSKVLSLLHYLQRNNWLYTNVEIDHTFEDIPPYVPTGVLVESNSLHEDVANAVDEEQESVSTRTDAMEVSDQSDEATMVERSIMFTSDNTMPSAGSRVVEHPISSVANAVFNVYTSNQFAGYNNGLLYGKMYAHLFPFGRGTPAESRRVPVSARDCVKYYLQLSSRRFAHDQTFALVAFDKLSLENMYMRTSLTVQRNPGMYTRYANVSGDQLRDALHVAEARNRGFRIAARDTPTDASSFLNSVQSASVSIWGSNAEREKCRREAFAYQTLFGQPTLFVTISPNTDNSLTMVYYSGGIHLSSLYDTDMVDLPPPSKFKKLVMHDNAASARLFDRMINVFVENVLCYGDDETSGLFGVVKAYYGMVEAQGRGTLHTHFLVWVDGAPPNSTVYQDVIDNPSLGTPFRDSLLRYTDSVATTKFPIGPQAGDCTACGASLLSVQPLTIPPNARIAPTARISTVQSEPESMKCICGQTCSSQHYMRSLILQNRRKLWPPTSQVDDIAQSCPTLIRQMSQVMDIECLREIDGQTVTWLESNDGYCDSYVHMDDTPMRKDTLFRRMEMEPPTILDPPYGTSLSALVLAVLVYSLNTHWWRHTNSCFKKSNQNRGSPSLCRYHYPRNRCAQTTIENASITLQRRLGDEFTNPYNDVLMLAFKCNHDVQVMVGGKDMTERVFYVTKYLTKLQRNADANVALAIAAYQRRRDREELQGLTDTLHVGRGRVASMAYHFTNKQEVAGPLAVFYILHGACHYSSHNSARVLLSSVMNQLTNAEHDAQIVPIPSNDRPQSTFAFSTSLDDYIYRPSQYNNLSLYEFSMWCYRRPATDATEQHHRFREGHPLCASHYVARHRKPVVPVIIGPRLPEHEEDDEEKRELHGQIALVLFKPFRAIHDLVQMPVNRDIAWASAYASWKHERSSFVVQIMQNMYDYHRGRAQADAVEPANINDNEFVAEDYNDEDTQRAEAIAENFGVYQPEAWGYESDNDGYSDIDGYTTVPSTDTISPLVVPSAHRIVPIGHEEMASQFHNYELLLQLAKQTVLRYSSITQCNRGIGRQQQEIIRDEPIYTVQELREWISNSATDNSINDIDEGINLVRFDELHPNYVREQIRANIEDQARWDPSVLLSDQSRIERLQSTTCATLNQVSRAYTLNYLQHVVFMIIGTCLLKRWDKLVSGEDSTPLPLQQPLQIHRMDQQLRSDQMLMILGGQGGTGKSRVIAAIDALCRSWGRPKALIKTALTGKAATIIGGKTFASFYLLLKNGGMSEIAELDLLIIDEISMMKKSELVGLNDLLQRAKRVPNVLFGGVNILLVGDFLQLPPVRGEPLYLTPNVYDYKVILGYELWRQFDKVVYLTESMRFRSAEWAEGCSSARTGNWTDTFVKLLNTRCLHHFNISTSSGMQNTTFVTQNNATRHMINNMFMQWTAQNLPVNHYPIRIKADFGASLNAFSATEIRWILGLPDTNFKRLPPFLDTVPGMPIMITQNVRTQKGIANGTTGRLHHIQFPETTNFRLVKDHNTGTKVLIPDQNPLYALVHVRRGSGAHPIRPGTDTEIIPILFDGKGYNIPPIQLPTSTLQRPRIARPKIKQFPFVCAAACTIYKVQGETLESMVTVEWKTPTGNNKPQQAYLMVSRVVSEEGFFSLQLFTQEHAREMRPPQHALEEDKRLQVLSRETVRDYEQSLLDGVRTATAQEEPNSY